METDPPTSFLPALCQQFSSLIRYFIDADLPRSAVFYAERYFALDQQDHDARHLYASALLCSKQPHSALCLVNQPDETRCAECLELKAKCCTALGRYRLAREALEESLQEVTLQSTPSITPRIVRNFSDEAVLRCRSGMMALRGNLRDKAGPSFRRALALNPLIWEALEGLCAIGQAPDIDELFPPRPHPKRRMSHEKAPHAFPTATGAGFFTPDNGNTGNLFRQPPAFRTDGHDSFSTDNTFAQFEDSMLQPHMRPSRSHPDVPPATRPLSSADETGPVPKKLKAAAARNNKPGESSRGAGEERARKSKASGSKAAGPSRNGNEPVPTRRSARLTGASNKPAQTKNTRRRQRTQSRTLSTESDTDDNSEDGLRSRSRSRSHSRSPSPVLGDHTHDVELADEYIYDLTRRFALATKALYLHDSQTCLDELENLSKIHRKTPWVMAMAGRAHYECTDYAEAERAFQYVRNWEPCRLWDMEIYSTLLWHLQRNVELSFLSQELLAIDARSPQAWIAVGNCFSLQKERTQALTCFRRAAQLDPTCAYAYTLSGHETTEEDLDKAVNFFQSALRCDQRHYNAWYGLGTCYLKMSKLRLAEYHFRKAVEIHPHNAVLIGCVALVLERQGDRERALELYNEAVELSKDNALVRYRRAKILISIKRYRSAVEDLEYLRDITPDESNVIFQLAKVYRLMGDEVKSTQLLAIARDISPKSVNKIKKLLETVKDEEGDQTMDDG